MKRTIVLFGLLLLCAALLACTAPAPDPAEPVALVAPAEQDVSLMLPLGARGDVTRLLKGYTDGFDSRAGKLLTFSTESADPDVALSSLFEDGTLCILAVHTGSTTVSVTAVSETGESAVARVNVTVRDARRVAVLVLVGVLVVVLLILFGQPNGKKSEPDASFEPPAELQAEASSTIRSPEQGGEA